MCDGVKKLRYWLHTDAQTDNDDEVGIPPLSCRTFNKKFVLCTCSQLRDVFVYQLTQGFSHFDRQLRNDLLVIISLISAASLDIPYVQSGLAKHLALIATFQEGCLQLDSINRIVFCLFVISTVIFWNLLSSNLCMFVGPQGPKPQGAPKICNKSYTYFRYQMTILRLLWKNCVERIPCTTLFYWCANLPQNLL